MRQIDAVIEAVKQVAPDFKFNYDKGNEIIVDELRTEVVRVVTLGVLSGEVDYGKDKADVKAVEKYVKGMVSNWLRRNKMLNGNKASQAQKPGSRMGSSDPQLKTLRELRKTQVDEECLAEIDKYIRARIKELKSHQLTAKQDEINQSALPAHIQALLKKG